MQELSQLAKLHGEQSSIDEERDFASAQGWNRLGRMNVKVKVQLGDQERIEAGEKIALNNVKIRDLQEQRKALAKSVKEQIDEIHDETMSLSELLNEGAREENKILPCFYDHENNSRCFVDMATGEIVRREQAEPGDRQLRIV